MTQYRDGDGDVWGEDQAGGWHIVQSDTPTNIGLRSSSLATMHELYGPLTEVEPTPVYVTHEELADIFDRIVRRVSDEVSIYRALLLAADELRGDQ